VGRSLAGIVRTVETLRERGVMLRSLREGIDYSTAVGRMVAGVFAALAEYERELIHERAAAREAARARGRHTGRPRALTPDQVRIGRRMREAGESMPTIAATLRVVPRHSLPHAGPRARRRAAHLMDRRARSSTSRSEPWTPQTEGLLLFPWVALVNLRQARDPTHRGG